MIADEKQLDSLLLGRAQSLGSRLFDISDYLASCISRSGITGIQRVQEAVTRELLFLHVQVAFVMVDEVFGRVWTFRREDLLAVLGNDNPALAHHDLETRGRAAEKARDRAQFHTLSRNDLLINAGAFWSAQYGSRFENYLFKSGCQFIPVVYDLIPAERPDLCEEQTVKDFIHSLPRVFRQASRIFAISEFTRNRILVYAKEHQLTIPEIEVMPLAHQFKSPLNSRLSTFDICDLFCADEGFVLCVGTLEPRKNQLRLAEIWARLAKDIVNMPTLLIVGKMGWIKPADIARIKELAHSSKKIVLAHHIMDEALASLYQQCLFTVFIPEVEGWGLPVGESLSFGKICLAANVGAVSEVGGDLALYINPANNSEIDLALRSLIVGVRGRRILERRIAQEFHARNWSDVANDLLTSTQMILRK